MITMPFGKHKNKPLSTIPTHYLCWVLANVDDLRPYLRSAVIEELSLRGQEPFASSQPPPPPQPWPQPTIDFRALLKTWYGNLSMRFHPDRGGNNERMLALNIAREELERLLGQEGVLQGVHR